MTNLSKDKRTRKLGVPLLQMHCRYRKLGKKFPERKLRGLNPNFYLHISVSDFYCTFRRSACLFRCSNIGGPILGIYINRSQMYEYGTGNKAAQFDFWDYIYLNLLCSACATKYREISLATECLKLSRESGEKKTKCG